MLNERAGDDEELTYRRPGEDKGWGVLEAELWNIEQEGRRPLYWKPIRSHRHHGNLQVLWRSDFRASWPILCTSVTSEDLRKKRWIKYLTLLN